MFNQDGLIDHFIGDKNVSGAENLLPEIQRLLDSNRVKKSEIDLIAVSIGPGSYTGIRIGIATCLALEKSTGIKCVGVDLLEALANYAEVLTGKRQIIAAVTNGRNKICFGEFDLNQKNIIDYLVSDQEELIKFVNSKEHESKDYAFITDKPVYADLITKIQAGEYNENFIDAGKNMSEVIARVIFNRPEIAKKPSPLYLSE